MKLEFSRQIFESADIKFHENPSCGSRLFHSNGRTDMTKLIFTFRNYANAPKNMPFLPHRKHRKPWVSM